MAEHLFETASTETLHVGNIFALRSDKVRMPGGRTAVREVLEHYGAVAIVAMNDDHSIPLVYQYRQWVSDSSSTAASGRAQSPARPSCTPQGERNG